MQQNMISGKKFRISFYLLFQYVILWNAIALLQNCTTSSIAGSKQQKNSFAFIKNIGYKTGDNIGEYEKERCKLDLYIPQGKKDFSLLVWFHGGSLQHGDKGDRFTKALAESFAEKGVALGVVNYRLSPKVKYPAYIDDAAAAVSWGINHISEYGGNPRSVFIGGHSAGGYLSLMLALDPSRLKKYGVDRLSIAGIVSIGGQTFTHYAIREERGIANAEVTPVIDEGAPCFHADINSPPILAVWADGDSPDRKAENRYLQAILKRVGNHRLQTKEMKNRKHWTLITRIPQEDDPLKKEILLFINGNRTVKINKNRS